MASNPPSSTTRAPSDPASYYNPTNRHALLGHISLGVRSLSASEKFYTAILAPFGVSLIYSSYSSKVLGYGFASNPEQEILNIFERGTEARAPGPGFHLAFNAPSRSAVRTFWEDGVGNGGTDEGAPGVRRGYGERYFAAFLWDPDGFKVEAVFQGISEEEGLEKDADGKVGKE